MTYDRCYDMTDQSFTLNPTVTDALNTSYFFSGDLQDVLPFDVEAVIGGDDIETNEEDTVSEYTFESSSGTTGPSPSTALNFALCMQMSRCLPDG